MKGGHNVGNPELVKYLTDNAYPTVEWMEKEGVVFRDKIGAATGSLGQRSHYGKKPAGYAYTSAFENKLKEFLMFPCVNYPRVFTYLNRSSTF